MLLSSSRSRKLRTRSCSFPSSSIARSGTSRRRAATCICNHAAAVVGRVVTPVSCCPFCHFCARRGEVGKCISGSLSRIAGQQPFGSARSPARTVYIKPSVAKQVWKCTYEGLDRRVTSFVKLARKFPSHYIARNLHDRKGHYSLVRERATDYLYLGFCFTNVFSEIRSLELPRS